MASTRLRVRSFGQDIFVSQTVTYLDELPIGLSEKCYHISVKIHCLYNGLLNAVKLFSLAVSFG